MTGNYGPEANISNLYKLAPGEEKEIGRSPFFMPIPSEGRRFIVFFSDYSGKGKGIAYGEIYYIASSYCTRTAPYGVFIVNNFGFEYTQTIEGSTITKRQIGAKPLAIKCTDAPYDW